MRAGSSRGFRLEACVDYVFLLGRMLYGGAALMLLMIRAPWPLGIHTL
jgi:hypothetical protein